MAYFLCVMYRQVFLICSVIFALTCSHPMNHFIMFLSFLLQIIPAPANVPQCKALYDFRMTNDEEDGCLTFTKVHIFSKSSVICVTLRT